MDLFCGSGNFGRGLEEGGAVEMRWANDIWDKAIHTYMANTADPKATKPFLGSVDDLLRLALEGKFSDKVPRPGEVEFISAGSPCPGFSLLTVDKTTLAQIKNQSLVASFASFIDFYRPKYGILENVSSIVQARHNRSGDFLSQLFCAIVGMGYQAQLILGDAWSHGAPQSRNRIFLYFAAPHLPLPTPPLLSHSHYPGVNGRGLGKMSNGQPFVSRSFQPTPFAYVSASQGTADLPPIGDGKAEPGAHAFPDHRVCAAVTSRLRCQIAAIPTHPHGMSFAKAWRGGDGSGVMTPAERALFPAEGLRVSSPISVGWRRVRPGDVFGTVTTHSQPTDARAGTGLHWADDRPLTIMEVRRAQGFVDDEVLVGSSADQWKLVGNSVARQMAVALGLRFGEAWAGAGAGGVGEREGSGSVSVEAAPVSVAGDVRTVKRNGARRSTPREICDLTAVVTGDLRTAAKENGHSHSHVNTTREVIDLTFETGPPDVHCNGISGDVVDLTLASRSTTPVSAMSETARTGGTRKRLLSQSLEPEFEEIQPRKAICLESGESSPVPVPQPERESEPLPTNGVSGPWTMHAEWEVAAQGEEAAQARTGPTVVRIWTPEEMGSDGLGPDDDLS
jgi:DNA (cytosine-5)-methyltransferase 1